jgi:hypothetical protein
MLVISARSPRARDHRRRIVDQHTWADLERQRWAREGALSVGHADAVTYRDLLLRQSVLVAV